VVVYVIVAYGKKAAVLQTTIYPVPASQLSWYQRQTAGLEEDPNEHR
jgi:hypothetical protein